jgi:hypothetical protein
MDRPRCVLLDAGPVIFLHAAGVWVRFCEAFDVVIPETVAEDEALFHSRDSVTGASDPISVRAEEKAGRVTVVSATSTEVADVAGLFSDDFIMGLHDGELEGLGLLARRDGLEGHAFCTGDGAAIQAAMMIGLEERCMPLESLLDSVGLRQPVPKQLSRAFFETHRRHGLGNRVTGSGLHRR